MRFIAAALAGLVAGTGCSGSRDAPIASIQSTRVDSLIRLADSTYRQNHDSARRIWELALTEATAQGDSANVARALTGIGMAARLDGAWDYSRRISEQALEIKERRGMGPRDLFRSYNSLALLAWNTGRYREAAQLLARAGASASAARDPIALGMVTINTGLVEKDLGAFDRSREAFLRGRDIARSNGDSVNLGRALTNLAMLDIALGDPLSAITSIEESRRLARLTGDSITEVNARGHLATAYSALGDPQRAFAVLDSARTMAERAGRRHEVAEDLLLLGDLFSEAGDPQHALDHYQRARLATDSIEQPEEHGNILRSEAMALAELGNGALAKARISEALRIHRAAGLSFPELNDLVFIANLAQREGRPEDAEAHLRAAERLAATLEAPIAVVQVALARARIAAQRKQWKRVLAALENVRGTIYLAGTSGEAESFALQARALGELGSLESALAAGRLAIGAIERVRSSYASSALRTSFTASRAQVFAQHVLLLLRLGRVAEAFEVADGARGRALLDHLSQARGDFRTTAGAREVIEQESVLRRIEALLGRLQERERTPPRERSADERAATAGLRDSVDALRAEYTALVSRNVSGDGARARLSGARRASEREIRQKLRHDEALLEYLVTPERLLIFTATRSTLQVDTVPEPADALASRVQLARELLRDPATETEAHGVLRSLFDIVLRPVLHGKALGTATRLIIVPHGVLTYLPLAALNDGQSYVAERFELLHLPTSAALLALRATPSAKPAVGMTEVFVPTPGALPATRREADAIASVLGGARLHVGSRATERRFRAAVQRGGVVHVASHARLNNRNPLFSSIELSVGDGSSATDNGRLEAHELLGMRMAAMLVFLSGCETAVGGAWTTRFDSGEDYAALAQTLLYAGVKNVVATLWRIDDVGAAEFARYFYEAVPKTGYAEAIALAQRRLIRDQRFRSPYYWAAYQVNGGG